MEPWFRVFAPGYEDYRRVVTPATGQPFVDPTVVEMRPLKTRQERVDALLGADGPTSVPAEKKCILIRAINQERKKLGFTSMYPECAR